MASERTTIRMRRALGVTEPDPVWPDGVRVRAFEPGDARTVHDLLDEAYSAWDDGYVPLSHEEWLAQMVGDYDFDASVWWLAESDGELVGCALHWGSGWVKDLAVRESRARPRPRRGAAPAGLRRVRAPRDRAASA